MKKYALEYRGYKFDYFSNLGDEIQTLAAIRNLGQVDGFISREHLDQTDINGLVSLNGFFMGSNNWPPHESLTPVFFSFHLDKKYESVICSSTGVQYLKYHGPIGCRDKGTATILSKYGIESFYSGCLTLTFPKRSSEQAFSANEIFIVGVDKELQSVIPKNISKKAVQINQSSIRLPKISCETKRQLAREILDGYANNAKLIITSKIHCAMPCMAMGIPVVFLYPTDKACDYRTHIIKDYIPINYVPRSKVLYRLRLQKLFTKKIDWNPVPVEFEQKKQEIRDGFLKAVDRAINKLQQS